MLPVCPLPRTSVKRCRKEGMPAMAARLAPTLRVPATIGSRWTADMVGGRDGGADWRGKEKRVRND